MNSYESVMAYLEKGRNKEDRPLRGRATRAVRNPDGSVAVRYHDTDVVTFMPDGRTILWAGPYRTATTKERINEYMPAGFALFQENSAWIVSTTPYWNNPDRQEYLFADGLTIHPDGSVSGHEQGYSAEDVRKFASGVARYAHEHVKRVLNDKLDPEIFDPHDFDVLELVVEKRHPAGLLMAAINDDSQLTPFVWGTIMGAISAGEETDRWSRDLTVSFGTRALRAYLRRNAHWQLPVSGWQL